MASGATKNRLGTVNRSAVLQVISKLGPISRAELSRNLGLSPATITSVTQPLIAAGVITEEGQEQSRGGRPGTLLRISSGKFVALGVKITEDRLVGTLVDLTGQVLSSFSDPVRVKDGNPLQLLSDALQPHVHGDMGGARLLGIGLGLAGSNDPDDPGIVSSSLLSWHALPMGSYLARELGVPVMIDNDVNTLAAAESLYGVGARYSSFLTCTLGRGVGMGIVMDGELIVGAHGAAGEFGHVTVTPDGYQCECGKRGCLETIVADAGLVRAAADRGLLVSNRSELHDAAQDGNPDAIAVFNHAGSALGAAMANVVNVLDPAAIVVSGEGSMAWPHLADAFSAALERGRIPRRTADVAIVRDEWDDDKWALGAAALVTRAALGNPLGASDLVEAIQSRLVGADPATTQISGAAAGMPVRSVKKNRSTGR